MTYTVAVRALCEFTAKAGDLDLRFTPSPSALEGMEGHAAVRSKRAAGYESEISLSGEHGKLCVRGRADGYDPLLNQLEEIKTFRGKLDAIPAHHRVLHWAQAKIYAHLLCVKLAKSEMRVALVYFDIVERKETQLVQTCTAEELEEHFHWHCDRFAAWAEQETGHRIARDQALEAMSFPFDAFRAGQRQLAVAVYSAMRQERCLMAQAPTGIGKTVGTLFPMLKSCPRDQVDKVFYLTAKTSGRQLALDALSLLAPAPDDTGGPSVRTLELTARDKACEYPGQACHGEACPLAQGFYDRLPHARAQAVSTGMLDKTTLRNIALEHRVCPYWLGQDLAKWCDLIVGDYNYFFDSSALLYSLTVSNQWRVGVLADEAHNLLGRARKMYSAQLGEYELRAAQAAAPPVLKKVFTSLLKSWREACRDQEEAYQAYSQIPAKLLAALLRASGMLGDYLAEHPLASNKELQAFHFDVLHFLRLAEVFGQHSIFDITLNYGKTAARSSSALCIRNMIPAPFLQPRFEACRSATLFSATLSPWTFYRDTLGLPENAAWIDVDSPFRPEQLHVRITRQISTRYTHRARSLGPIAQLMGRQFQQRPGNYLSYFSSFEYLQQAADEFARCFPDIPSWRQARSMDEAEKEAFLARFHDGGTGIGFAVLGGAFAEGIDLPGRRLIGAFVSTLGLPQVNGVNQQLKRSMDAAFGAQHGYDYAYLYPGIQKVVQAAGRVIRSSSDEGVVHLIDDRYGQPRIQALFPRWWQVEYAHHTQQEGEALS